MQSKAQRQEIHKRTVHLGSLKIVALLQLGQWDLHTKSVLSELFAILKESAARVQENINLLADRKAETRNQQVFQSKTSSLRSPI